MRRVRPWNWLPRSAAAGRDRDSERRSGRRSVPVARGPGQRGNRRVARRPRTRCTPRTGTAGRGGTAFAERLTELLAAGIVGPPVWRGSRRFFMRRGPGQEHAVLFTVDGDGPERVLIDPMPSTRAARPRWTPGSRTRRAGCWPTSCPRAAPRSPCCGSWTWPPASRWTARSTAAGTPRSPGCRAARRSTTSAGCRPSQVPAGEEQYHRRVYLHRVGHAAGRGRAGLRRGPGQDQLLRRLGVSRDGRWLRSPRPRAPRRATTCGWPT